MMLEDSEPEPAPRNGPTRVERAERPADNSEPVPADEAPADATAETAPADTQADTKDDTTAQDGTTPQQTAQGENADTAQIPGLPGGATADGDAGETAVVAAQPAVPANQPVPILIVQRGGQPVTGIVPAEDGEHIAALGTTAKPVMPQVDAKAPGAPTGATAPADPSAALPADGAVDTEAAATAPVIKAAAGKSAEEKSQGQPAELETVTLAPEQQARDAKKPDAPALPQSVKPEAAARPQVAADPLAQSDLTRMAGHDIDMKAQGEQIQAPTLATTHPQTTQATIGSNVTVQAQQQPLVPITGLAVEIAAQARAGKNRFEIRLDPPELGRIDVRLDVDREGNVSSRLVVERAETLDLLRRDAHSLERALNQAGLKTSDDSLQFSLRDQNADQGQGDGQQRGGERLIVADDEHAGAQPARGYERLLGLGGGLDIRV